MNKLTRSPIDLARLSANGECLICQFLAGVAGREHIVIAETDTAVAFLNKFPTLYGYVLVAPRQHVEQVTGDFTLAAYLALQQFIYTVAEAVRTTLSPERVYLLSLGSQAANAHVHWHIAPLPEGLPLAEQQYYALMHENGVVEIPDDEMLTLGDRLRRAIEVSMQQLEDT